MIHVAIHGAAGRMGRRLVALTTEDPELRLAAALEHAGNTLLGQDAGTIAGVAPTGVKLAAQLPSGVRRGTALPGGGEQPASASTSDGGVDVLIDFTLPAGTRQALDLATRAGTALVIGTTGLTAADHAAIDAAARTIAVLQSPNMSLGVNLLFALAGQVAKRLGDDYDIEIVEAHHRFKKDAPSGTALGIAHAICAATGKSLEKDLVHGRHGDEVPRRPGQIGVHALRMGDVVGDHTVSFATPGERLELTHRATSRDVFARGALRAAKWLKGRAPGRYSMADVLGLGKT